MKPELVLPPDMNERLRDLNEERAEAREFTPGAERRVSA